MERYLQHGLDEEIFDLELSKEEKELITKNRSLLWREYEEHKQALQLHYLSGILSKQVEKAMKGDTSAAKFLVDLVAPEEAKDDDIDRQPVAWESKAIAIRDSLQLPISAEVLVLKLLDIPLPKLRDLLAAD